ncbi:DUF3037 domain-containing protein [Plantibacter sp. VKM Ac-2880]|uniref:DUF3037 domain-containing protein n=1 Tax=Plantibacter sp. VKM Ac-2880 TaxID=2783827 RepID=UPI00188FDD08|nr:DUF3037 domain-containing protein [Plantibacter sp. VKM Ac-2880]MBF4568523.1 DUF3037 domain-containing protein [Plantibacter sp. VKM Ac-2880]
MNYHYWIIRFVPNVARGEFSNIGILSGRDGGDWAVGFDPRFTRSHGALSSDLRELSSWIRWFQKRVSSHATASLDGDLPAISSGWIGHVASRQANTVQFSSPAPIESESARDAVNLLFPHLVERESARRRRTLDRRALRADVRDLFTHELGYRVGSDLFVQPRASIGKQRGAFDLLRTSLGGDRLTNVWAFNVATLENLERDIQSWNFLVSRLRSDGATVSRHDAAAIHVAADVPIEVAYDAPTSTREAAWRSDIFEAAREAWSLNDVAVLPFDDYLRNQHDSDLFTV